MVSDTNRNQSNNDKTEKQKLFKKTTGKKKQLHCTKVYVHYNFSIMQPISRILS